MNAGRGRWVRPEMVSGRFEGGVPAPRRLRRWSIGNLVVVDVSSGSKRRRSRTSNLRPMDGGSWLRASARWSDDHLPHAEGAAGRGHALGRLVGPGHRRRANARRSRCQHGRLWAGRRAAAVPGLASRDLDVFETHGRRRRRQRSEACSWKGTRSNSRSGRRTGAGSPTRTRPASTSSTSPPARRRWSPKARPADWFDEDTLVIVPE